MERRMSPSSAPPPLSTRVPSRPPQSRVPSRVPTREPSREAVASAPPPSLSERLSSGARAVAVAVGLVLLLIVIAGVGVATRACPHGVRRALQTYKRYAARTREPQRVDIVDGDAAAPNATAPPPPRALVTRDSEWSADAAGTFRSGDLLFLVSKRTIAAPWLPPVVRAIKQEVMMHMGIVLRHPAHGLLFVDATCIPGHALGAVLPPSALSRAAPNVLRPDGAYVNGAFRALPLGAALEALKGCAWARHVVPSARADADNAWAALLRINAAVPRELSLAHFHLYGRGGTGIEGRMLTWASRGLGDALPQLTDGAIHPGAAHHLSCLHACLLLLEAAGLWAHAPHRLDGPSRRVAGLDFGPIAKAARAAYDRNWAASPEQRHPAADASVPPPIHAMPVDLSTDSRVPESLAFWGHEVLVPTQSCPVDTF